MLLFGGNCDDGRDERLLHYRALPAAPSHPRVKGVV
jgi:hypothetical protein